MSVMTKYIRLYIMNVDSKRTKPLTFRIETKVLEKIREEGGNNQISVSNFINKIFIINYMIINRFYGITNETVNYTPIIFP